MPLTLDGEPSRPLPLGPSERLLARSPRVSLERRAYGPTQVALIRVRRGIKELHPPSVCLKAAGYEVVSEQQLALSHGGCLQQLKVRDAQRRSFHFLAGYIADGGDVDCSYAAQAGRAIWQRLTGRRTATAALQVMDTELTRARQVAIALLGRIARSAQPARTKQEATKR